LKRDLLTVSRVVPLWLVGIASRLETLETGVPGKVCEKTPDADSLKKRPRFGGAGPESG